MEFNYHYAMEIVQNPKSDLVEINGDTPTMRLFSLLEAIATKDQIGRAHV